MSSRRVHGALLHGHRSEINVFAGLIRLIWGVLLALGLAPQLAHADYPERPVKVVVGFPPGGGGDLYGRLIADQLTRRLGKAFVVENRGGAGGNLAADQVAKSKPDGYTLLLAMSSNLSVAGVIKPDQLPYKTPDDFAAVGMILQAPHGLFAAQNGFKTATEAFSEAKKRKLSHGSSGPGSVGHVTMEMIKRKAGVEIVSVPYRGSGPAINDLIGGQIDLFFATAPPLIGQVRAGKMRVLALTGEKRNPRLPEVPTFKELGIDVTVTQWYGLVAPAGTPPAVLRTLSKHLSDALRDPEVQRVIAQDGGLPVDLPLEQFRDYIVQDIANYKAGIDAQLLKQLEQ